MYLIRFLAELNALPPPYSHPHPLTPQYYLTEMATPEETDVLVSRADFEHALHELVPSVSQEEMEHYAEVQRKFASDTINAVKEEIPPSIVHAAENGDRDEVAEKSYVVAPLISRMDKGKSKAVE